jgi:AraC family transcriptional regulator
MLKIVNTSGYAAWPGAIADAIGNAIVSPALNKAEPGKGVQDSRATEQRSRQFGDVTRLYPEAVAVCSDTYAWQGVRVIHLRHRLLNELVIPPSDNHCLVLNLSAPLELNAHLGKTGCAGNVRAGEVAIIPAGTPWSCQSAGSRTYNLLLLYLRPLYVRNAAADIDASYEELPLTPQIGFTSQHIRHIALSLLSELQERNVMGRLYADSLAIGLAMQLIRHYSSLKDVQIGHGGMAPHRLRKAIGLIDQHLNGEEQGRVGLRLVAKEVGMSYFHFSRAFKQSLGMSPTKYIGARRIERAKRLMQETDFPISEIALRSGFSSQSHFTTSFRRLTGVTPRSFRREI